MEVPAQCRWRCIEFVRLSFGTLSSCRLRQVAVGLKWSLAQVTLYYAMVWKTKLSREGTREGVLIRGSERLAGGKLRLDTLRRRVVW